MVSFSGGGGLKFWLENYSTATQTNVSFTPKVADANVSVVFQPKGTGAILAQIPTGTTVGGNARGSYAVDFQMERTNANQVSTGANSGILSGRYNRNNADRSTIGGGASNVIASSSGASFLAGGFTNSITDTGLSFIGSGDNQTISGTGRSNVIVGGGTNTISGAGSISFIGGGSGNSLTSDWSFIGGGRSNTVSGTHSFCGSGFANSVSGTYSVNVGGANNQATGNYSFIGGGGDAVTAANRNTASGNYSVVVGGAANTCADAAGFIGGGSDIQIGACSINYNIVIGGVTQRITAGVGGRNFIGGGEAQTINGTFRNSIIGGGASNSIGGSYSGIFSGQSNTNNATHSVIIGGIGNTINGYYHTVSGYYNTISGLYYTCNIFGENNTASANGVTILGASSTGSADGAVVFGYQANGGLFQQVAHAGGRFSANGDAQSHELIWRRLVTGTAQTELFLDGASIAAILPATNALWQGTIEIAAICTVTGNGTTVAGDVEATSYKVTIKRIGTTTSLVGTVQEIGTTNADASMSTGVFTIDNNDANESLRIQFTPPTTAGSTTVIRVVATFRGLQIQY